MWGSLYNENVLEVTSLILCRGYYYDEDLVISVIKKNELFKLIVLLFCLTKSKYNHCLVYNL